MRKIVFTVFIAFLISFSFFIFIQYSFQEELTVREKEFFSRNFNNTNSKILLLGSSHVGYLDAKIIQSLVNKHYPETEIFNLADTGDKPSRRIHQVPDILTINPKIVVYGISYRDFSDTQIDNGNIFPEPNEIITSTISFNNELLENPKKITLNIIRNTLGVEVNKFDKQPYHTPFFPYDNDVTNLLRNQDEINKVFNPEKNKLYITEIYRNSQLKAFDDIIEIFEENNVRVIVYVTPLNSIYLDNVSEQNKQRFADIIEFVDANHTIMIYSLLTNYTNSNVWAGPDHVTHGSNGLIYNQDVADMILKGLME